MRRESRRSPFLTSPGKSGGALAASSKWQHPLPTCSQLPQVLHDKPHGPLWNVQLLPKTVTKHQACQARGCQVQEEESGGRKRLRADTETDHRDTSPRCRRVALSTLLGECLVLLCAQHHRADPCMGQHPVWTEQRDCVLAIPTPTGKAQGPPNNRAITPPTKGRAREGCAAEEGAGRKITVVLQDVASPPKCSYQQSNLPHGEGMG